MTGYVRKQSYVDGDTILAEHTNDEFNALVEVFDSSVGHSHDGSEGEGSYVSLLSDLDNDTKIDISTTDADTIDIYAAGAKKASFNSTGMLFGDRFRVAYDPINDSLNFEVV
jgi:hypothetical protein